MRHLTSVTVIIVLLMAVVLFLQYQVDRSAGPRYTKEIQRVYIHPVPKAPVRPLYDEPRHEPMLNCTETFVRGGIPVCP